ncbi:hypothetical protein FOE78_02865 [Microlunatus elymi]|uniref:Uncharacterized protein n=1 Tax=Microlunatus elymi TaxID=2596828 RepID=A0A516PUY6_9ACTN|nr:hypothetical protein [Microlunatus elymi]QDP94997.1 hypothetical protein FOE78_02865 [Microlunatus elymi]
MVVDAIQRLAKLYVCQVTVNPDEHVVGVRGGDRNCTMSFCYGEEESLGMAIGLAGWDDGYTGVVSLSERAEIATSVAVEVLAGAITEEVWRRGSEIVKSVIRFPRINDKFVYQKSLLILGGPREMIQYEPYPLK